MALAGLFVLGASLLTLAVTLSLPARAEGPAGTLGPPACATPIAIEAPFASAYSCFDLGAVPSLPTNYGGLTFKLGDPNTIIIGGAANGSSGALYTISVVRDASQHVTGFSGEAARFADAADNDGGVVYGPGDVLFLARWPSNGLGEIKPGSSTTDRIVDLNPLSVCSALSALSFVPTGFPGAGQLKFVTYSGGCWYTASYEVLSDGTYGIPSVLSETTIGGGPEGFIYVPPGSPNFPDYDSMLVSEYGAGSIATYQLDGNGDPAPASRATFISGLTGAEGAVIDPLTGDFLFSTFGGANHVVRVSGFAAPATSTPAANETPTATPTPTISPTPTPTVPPTSTVPPTFTPPATATAPQVATATNTPIPPTSTVPPTFTPPATATAPQVATATNTPIPPTPFPTFAPAATFTPPPPTDTPLPPIVVARPTRLSPSPTFSPTATATNTVAPTPTLTPSSAVLGTENPPSGSSGGSHPLVRPARGAIVVGPEPRTTGNVLGLDQLSKDPKVVGTNFLLAIILLIVLLFTSAVFNGTLDEHRVEVQSFMRRLTAPFRWLGALQREQLGPFAQAAWAERIIGPVLLLGITCLIYTLNESGFGWNGKTAALFTSLVIGVGVTTYVVEGGEVLITTRRFRVPAAVRLFPVAIAIAGGFVLLSRVTSFEAPIMYGFVGSAAALTAVKLEQRESAFAVLLPALVLLALSLAAWFLLVPLRHATWDDGNWWAHVPSDTAALIFAAGIEGLLFTMIPVRFTDGAKIFRWHRLLWFPLFLIPAFLFSWVLLNPAAKGFDALIEGRVIFALALVGAYVASTVAFWAFFALRDRGEAPAPPPAPPSGTGGGRDAHAHRPALAPLEGDLPAALPHDMPVYLTLYRRPRET